MLQSLLYFLISTDTTHKMTTGTIALKVGDTNDNCPSLVNRLEHVCEDTEVVHVTAVDKDGDPNSAPLTFSIVTKESQGEWRVEPLNGELSLPICVKKKKKVVSVPPFFEIH